MKNCDVYRLKNFICVISLVISLDHPCPDIFILAQTLLTQYSNTALTHAISHNQNATIHQHLIPPEKKNFPITFPPRPFWFVSSVRSSYSHPDLLLIHHQQQHPHFFRSHRSSTLDFHFLSHYSYIKAIMLYKGNHWTHLLAICIPDGNKRTSLQDSVR